TRLLQDKIEALEQQNPREFPDQVQSVMRTALAFDRVRADQLAAMFSMHVRTFHRHLAIHGTSHQELLNRTRFAVACQLLEGSSRNLAAIADLLGYAEPRSFNRAFWRWSGMTPARWREERRMSGSRRSTARADRL
ncbi:MAG TPA: AraC family transcriptional regulator, partial [Methyloceanibacter sp.]|nr:AraC family transcriptional regulator [Methyloceanibacter sp.]